MTPVILIYVYVFVFVAILIVVADTDQGVGESPGECQSTDSSPRRNYSVPEESAQVESFDLLGEEGGSRIGDHIITSQSDLPDFDSVSDSWDDSWSHDDW